MSATARATRGDANARLMRLATYASVGVAGVLIVIKTGAWLATDSVVILSSLIDSVLDSMASVINLIAVRHALTPADYEHRFGHGKAESLAGLAQSAFIMGSALFLLFVAGSRLITPRDISYGDVGIAVMVVSIVLTFALVWFQTHVARRTGSTAIAADSVHYKADLLVNVGVIVSLVLVSRLGWTLLDPLFAIAIAIYIVYGVWGIARKSLNVLMDREVAIADREHILEIVRAHPAVKGVHDLRTRLSGTQPFIQLHLELSGDMTLTDAHIVSDQVEAEIMAEFPDSEVIIHQDPEGLVEPPPKYARTEG
jgi:ferrous-iron efflux pump FieF